MKSKGFTLIEIILYIGIISLIMTSMVQFSISLLTIKSKSQVQQEVDDNIRLVANKISYEIRQAKSINLINPSSISISTNNPSRNPTVINLNSGSIQFGFGTTGNCPASAPCSITSPKVNISQLNFTNLSTGDSRSINIRFTISANYKNPGGRFEFNHSSSVTSSAEMRSK